MDNQLRDFLTDEQYEVLLPFLNKTVVRDYNIKKKYKELRKEGMRAGDAIDIIVEEYPYLQWESIRKITSTGGTFRKKV